MRPRWLSREVIAGPHMALCLSEREYLRVCRHLDFADPPHWIGAGAARTHIFERGDRLVAVVCMGDARLDKEPIQIAALLVHEALHVKQHLFDSMCEHTPSAEFEAYTVQAIAQELMYEYARRIA